MKESLKSTLGLSESRYADELEKGAVEMRFAADLEREYHAFYLAERQSHVRSFNAIMCVLAVVTALSVGVFHGAPAIDGSTARLIVIAAAYAAMVWASRSRFYEPMYLKVAEIASAIIAVAASLEIAYRITAGSAELFGLLTIYSIGLYFLAGILFRAALRANVALVVSFAAGLVFQNVTPLRAAYLVTLLAAVAAIGGLAFRHQGIRFRRTFLERGLIAELAARDGLTGLTNRRGFATHLTRAWQQALRDRKPIALMMIDVDQFKAFNDRYGHQAGDQALQRVAAVASRVPKRALDLAARYGGEELAVILYDTPASAAELLANTLCTEVRKLGITHLDGAGRGVVTVSIGVAIVHPSLKRSPDGAIQLADEALYAAKRAGRDRVVVFETEYVALSTGAFRIPSEPVSSISAGARDATPDLKRAD